MSVFFFKQKTAYEMRISDWSSDVCSSDLLANQHCVAALLEHYRTSHEKPSNETWDQFLSRCSEQDFEDGEQGCCFPAFWQSAMKEAATGPGYPNVYREAAIKWLDRKSVV